MDASCLPRRPLHCCQCSAWAYMGVHGRTRIMKNECCELQASLVLKLPQMFVLDEADEMLSRGFKDQIYDIFQLLPPKLQVGAWAVGCLQVWMLPHLGPPRLRDVYKLEGRAFAW